MQPSPLSDLQKPEPVRDDLFGHGQSYGDEKPPDVERMWKDFNRKLNKLLRFGRKKKPDEPDPDDPFNDREAQPRALKLGFLLLSTIGFIFWLGTGVYVVGEGEIGVVTTFGRFSRYAESGFNWHIPMPIQNHEVVNVSKIRTVEVGYRNNIRNKRPEEALMLTSDGNMVEVQMTVQYQLKDAASWIFNHQEQEEMMRQVSESVIREGIGAQTMAAVVYESQEEVVADIRERLQKVLDEYETGVKLTNVAMQSAHPPEQVQIAYDDVIKAKEDRERLRNEGEAYANEIIPKARGEADRMKEEAEAYRRKVVINAEGDTERFRHIVAEYQKAPAVTRDRMYIETMEQILSNTTKLLIDSGKGGKMLYLPIDKMMEKGGDGESAKPQDTASGSAQAEASDKNRTAREDRGRGGR